jgi:hypothetical protein
MDEPQRRWRFVAKDNAGNDVTGEIEALIQMMGLDQIAPGRYSSLLMANLFGGFKAGSINPHMVAHEIQALEAEKRTGLRLSSEFRHPPLKGLWHKHYMQSGIASLARNVQRGLNEYGIPYLKEKVREAEAAGELRFFTAKDAAPIAQDAVGGNWKRLQDDDDITGEWVIFAIHGGQNYYLSLGTHDKSAHGHLRDLIDAICCIEFPWLQTTLSDRARCPTSRS